ncbi:hypothetical protein O181_064000 [Austropuccinia psidii MF-1]|uniref:Retrotransposon gag domain-containing protein n=1 Tax=Austropuccinia psidii MF-1 TaxID=1389203 RepID=A0A9Q3ESC6_9BASI|nr:hypothetical protein [Austropuccinia psidii MF-1]
MEKISQEAAPRDNSQSPELKTLSMKAPDPFDSTKAHELRGFIQSCQLIFHNDPENFFSDRKKGMYSPSFLTGRAGKWIEPYLSNISNEDPSILLNNWQLFEIQLFTLLGDPPEVSKAHQQLDNLRMNESFHVSLYIAYFRSSMSIIGDWEKGLINVCRRGLASRDTRFHERKKEKGSHQEKKPPVTGSNFPMPPQDSSSKRPHHKKNKRASNFKCQRTIPIVLFLIRKINEWVLKRRAGSKKSYVLIVVESTQLKNASSHLKKSLGHQEASLASREKPEWGS